MMRSSPIKLASAALLLLCALTGISARANTVGYQGILTNAAGDSLLNGDFDFTFAIFPTETGGTAIWSESHTDVPVDNGVYSVQLGSNTPLPDQLGTDRWLQIAVDGTTLAPRLPISADFRAIEARHAENADSVNHIPAAATPTAGHLLPLGSDGKFPLEAMPFRADSVLAGQGLVGSVQTQRRSRSALDERIILNVGAGDGITVNADNVEAVLGEDIQTGEIDDNAVTSAKINDGGVQNVDLADGSVTANKIANSAVTSAKIADGGVQTVDLADGAVTTAKIAANAVTTAEIADNAVTSPKIANDAVNSAKVQDNSLTIADISPNIVSSVDGITNDGGDIDLIPGANITITPNNVSNTITIASGNSAVQGGVCIDVDSTTTPPTVNLDLDFISQSNCIDVDYDDVNCEVNFDFDFNAEGDECITADWDPDNCVLTVESLLSLVEGICIDIDYDPEDCDYTISVDMDCFDDLIDSLIIAIFDTLTIEVDSTFDSEVYARSFVVTDDPLSGSTTGARGHWRSDGTLELYGDGGDTVRINPDGTMEIIQDGELVAGLDENGEFFARSFMVINAQGDTVGHLTRDGDLEVDGGVFVGKPDDDDGHDFYPDGTWDAWQNNQRVAGLDSAGEIFARSFYVLNAQGDTVAHIRSDGKIEGGRVVVTEGGQTTDVQPGSVTTGGSSGSTTQSEDGISVTGSSSGVSISRDGTWTATQNDMTVAGLDNNGELYAKSFYVRDPVTGDTLAHITSEGEFLGPDGQPIGEGGGGVIDSVFDSEVYARSFVVTPDGTLESATIHLRSDGTIEVDHDTTGVYIGPGGVDIFDWPSGSGHSFGPDGTWSAGQDGQEVAGLDANGELFARSFYVIDYNGDTLIHLTSSGHILLADDETSVDIDENGITAEGPLGHSEVSEIGVFIYNPDTQSGHSLSPNGWWAVYQGGETVAGVDTTGEMYARSFFVRNAEGDTVAHITGEGEFLGPDGTPIGEGGAIDSVFDSEVYARSFVATPDGTLENATAHITSTGQFEGTRVSVEGGSNSVHIQDNGTWYAVQNGQIVAGLDNHGEIHANSFYIQEGVDTLVHITSDGNIELAEGGEITIGGEPIGAGAQDSIFSSEVYARSFVVTPDGTIENAKAHLTTDGSLELEGEVSGGGEITTEAPDGSGHTNRGRLTPTQMSVNNVNAEITSGWVFNADGSGTQYLFGEPGAQFTLDGYTVFPMPLFIGPQEISQYFFAEGEVGGINASGDFSVNGDLYLEGDIISPDGPSFVADFLPTEPQFRYEPGMVVVIDPNSDGFVPCSEPNQSTVMGIISPSMMTDDDGNLQTITYGSRTWLHSTEENPKPVQVDIRIKADASYGAIKRGDLLTTSATPGHAMLAAEPKLGTIVGKALESLESGTGEIKVMVTLN